MMLNAPNWVLHAMNGHSIPVARLLAFRDALGSCVRYIRQGRTRELLAILWTKATR